MNHDRASGSGGLAGIWLSSAAIVVGLAALWPATADAQTINNPPLLPQAVTVFPSRDFVSVEGFAANADLAISVRRDGSEVSDAVGRTDATGLLEVNHPGGVCWRNVTPDIGPGDTVRVTYRNTSNNQAKGLVAGSGAAANTLNATATQAFVPVDNPSIVVVKGQAVLGSGGRIPLNRLEVRIVQPEYLGTAGSRITRRDIRADSAGGRVDGVPGATGTLAYDSATSTTFTAVFTNLNPTEQQLTVQGQTRAMSWQQTTAAGDRLGMTIYEVGEVGGPGIGGCPPGPGGVVQPSAPTSPVFYNPANLLDATAPQPALVTVFPERDFVSIEGFPAGTDLQVVVRRMSDPTKPVIGTARGIVPGNGIFEVNHPGGVCWTGQTPDIQPGDWIDTFSVVSMGFNAGQKQQVIGAQVTRRATINSNGQVRVDGVAIDPRNNAPMALANVEQRIINPDFVTTRIGRRDIRADINGGRIDNIPGATGVLRDNGLPNWRVLYTGLNATEAQLAVAGQSRAMAWFSTNANGDRFGVTISEFGEVGGPGFGGCPATGNQSIAMP
jgi:hypothetical protein